MVEPTKGPWAIHPTIEHDVVDGEYNILARAFLYDSADIPREATFANARLIAAAPSLLEALEKAPIIGRTESHHAFRERQDAWLRDTYNPAIALAKGELSQEQSK